MSDTVVGTELVRGLVATVLSVGGDGGDVEAIKVVAIILNVIVLDNVVGDLGDGSDGANRVGVMGVVGNDNGSLTFDVLSGSGLVSLGDISGGVLVVILSPDVIIGGDAALPLLVIVGVSLNGVVRLAPGPVGVRSVGLLSVGVVVVPADSGGTGLGGGLIVALTVTGGGLGGRAVGGGSVDGSLSGTSCSCSDSSLEHYEVSF